MNIYVLQEETSRPATPAPESDAKSTSEDASPPNNALLAGGAAVVGIALFLFTRLGSGVSFADLEERSVPLDIALTNGKPTVVEFYASW